MTSSEMLGTDPCWLTCPSMVHGVSAKPGLVAQPSSQMKPWSWLPTEGAAEAYYDAGSQQLCA
jgi:hypothetical protein